MDDLFYYYEDYLNYLISERCFSINTVKGYNLYLIKFIDYLMAYELNFKCITFETIENFSLCLKEYGLKQSSRCFACSAVKQFFSFLIRENIMSHNPLKHYRKEKKVKFFPELLLEDEISIIIESLNELNRKHKRDRAIIELLYGSGLRVSEVVNVLISQINIEKKVINIFGKGNKERIVPISESFVMAWNIYILEYKNELTEYAFKISRWGITAMVKKHSLKCGINKNISAHSFRYAFASHLYINGVDIITIKNFLGHETLSTTDNYVHLPLSFVIDEFNKFHPRN